MANNTEEFELKIDQWDQLKNDQDINFDYNSNDAFTDLCKLINNVSNIDENSKNFKSADPFYIHNRMEVITSHLDTNDQFTHDMLNEFWFQANARLVVNENNEEPVASLMKGMAHFGNVYCQDTLGYGASAISGAVAPNNDKTEQQKAKQVEMLTFYNNGYNLDKEPRKIESHSHNDYCQKIDHVFSTMNKIADGGQLSQEDRNSIDQTINELGSDNQFMQEHLAEFISYPKFIESFKSNNSQSNNSADLLFMYQKIKQTNTSFDQVYNHIDLMAQSGQHNTSNNLEQFKNDLQKIEKGQTPKLLKTNNNQPNHNQPKYDKEQPNKIAYRVKQALKRTNDNQPTKTTKNNSV